jgi:hypothetical protein
MYDIMGSLEAIERRDNGRYDRYIVTARGSHSYEKNEERTGSELHGYFVKHRVSFVAKDYLQRKAKCVIYANLVDPNYLRLAEVGLTNLPGTLWEWLTLSFVADWAVNVGDYLDAINGTRGLSCRGVVTTTRQVDRGAVTYGRTPQILSPVFDLQDYSQYGFTGYANKAFHRSVGNSFPIPSVHLKGKPLNTVQMWDAISLLYQAVYGKTLQRPRH